MQPFRADGYLEQKVVITVFAGIQRSLAPTNVNSPRILWVPAQAREAGWEQEQLTKCERLRMNQLVPFPESLTIIREIR